MESAGTGEAQQYAVAVLPRLAVVAREAGHQNMAAELGCWQEVPAGDSSVSVPVKAQFKDKTLA